MTKQQLLDRIAAGKAKLLADGNLTIPGTCEHVSIVGSFAGAEECPPTDRAPTIETLDDLAERFGLTRPLREMFALLAREADAHGDEPGAPGWKEKDWSEHAEHLCTHSDQVYEQETVDPDSGADPALHAAARALFVVGTR